MKILSESQYNKARDYLKTYANDIDRAMFEYYFESKPVERANKRLKGVLTVQFLKTIYGFSSELGRLY